MLDLKNRLPEYIPVLFEFLRDETISWSKINSQFSKNFELRKQQYAENDNYLLIEASFYDILNESLNGNKSAQRLFAFFNKLIEELIINVPLSQIGKLKNTIYNY